MPNTFENLITEAQAQHQTGWDFSFIKNRWHAQPLPWAFGDDVLAVLEADDTIENLLDMDTGGGEFLLTTHARARRWPKHTYATEGYAPNVPTATQALRAMGAQVLAYEREDALPFPNSLFDLVVNRHGGFDAHELRRILKPGKTFITQQVGGEMNIGLNQLLAAPDPEYHHWQLGLAVQQLQAAGFDILEQREAHTDVAFDDIGAIVWYLLRVPWQIPGFGVPAYADRLRALHEKIQNDGSVVVQSHHFFIKARRDTDAHP